MVCSSPDCVPSCWPRGDIGLRVRWDEGRIRVSKRSPDGKEGSLRRFVKTDDAKNWAGL